MDMNGRSKGRKGRSASVNDIRSKAKPKGVLLSKVSVLGSLECL